MGRGAETLTMSLKNMRFETPRCGLEATVQAAFMLCLLKSLYVGEGKASILHVGLDGT